MSELDDGNTDAESEYTLMLNETMIAATRAMMPSGPTSLTCHDCGEEIPEDRRKAQPGCKFCIFCQQFHDKRLVVRMLDRFI